MVNCAHKSLKRDMHKVGVGTDEPHAQIKFVKQEIKQKPFRSSFEIKNWNEKKFKLIFN